MSNRVEKSDIILKAGGGGGGGGFVKCVHCLR